MALALALPGSHRTFLRSVLRIYWNRAGNILSFGAGILSPVRREEGAQGAEARQPEK